MKQVIKQGSDQGGWKIANIFVKKKIKRNIQDVNEVTKKHPKTSEIKTECTLHDISLTSNKQEEPGFSKKSNKICR